MHRSGETRRLLGGVLLSDKRNALLGQLDPEGEELALPLPLIPGTASLTFPPFPAFPSLLPSLPPPSPPACLPVSPHLLFSPPSPPPRKH